MTTSWGAGEDGGRGWEAPRLAYELAAAYAGSAASGGCGGPSFPEAAAKRWDSLDDAERSQVVLALTAQARCAIGELERVRPGHEALAALRSSLFASCDGACVPCAVALCRVEIAAWMSAGFAPDRIAAALAAVADGRPLIAMAR